ncbi:hypothetical protein ACU4GR_32615 (plasmid) [Methylobacterium oryzae CBMB20]
MTPLQYAEEIVLPAVQEARGDRRARRLGYVACIVTYHLGDYIARAHPKPGKDSRDAEGRALGDVRKEMRKVCPLSFEVVEGITNGTKHAGNEKGFQFNPGSERPVRGGFGMGMLGGVDKAPRLTVQVPGLYVEVREGQSLSMQVCVQEVLQSFKALFPDDLGSLDLSFCDQGTAPSAESLANATIVRREPPASGGEL